MDTPHLVWLCGALSVVCTFRDYCRCAPRAIAAQWGEPTSENNITFSPALSFGCGSSPESATKEKEMQKHSFRDYFAPSGLVPLLRNGANRHPRLAVRSPLLYRSDVVLPLKAQPKKTKNAKAFFQGLLRPFGARAIAAQWGEPRARVRRTLLAECVHFQGLLRRFAPRAAASGGANRHPRITFRSPLLCRSDVVLPLKAQPKKKRCKNASLFSWCTFRDSNPGPID